MAMRVLFTTPGGFGHIHPTVPLARAMAARGHDVLWAAPGAAVEHIESAGIRSATIPGITPVGPAIVKERYPELNELAPQDVPEAMFSKLFGAMLAPAMLEGLIPIVADFGPDMIVADAAEFAGHILAAERDIPSVTKGFGAVLPAPRIALIEGEVAPLWQSRGLEVRPFGGSYDRLYIDIFPAGLPSPDASHVGRRQPMRPVTYDGPAETPGAMPIPGQPADGPLVYVTMGTVFNEVGPLKAAVDALADLKVRALVTVGPRGDPEALGTVGPNVRVERYVPQSALLPSCDVVISHAGSGTAVATLALGLPQLCLPQGADQFTNAAAIDAAGAGLSLHPGDATTGAIAAAVTRLLDEDSFRSAAADVSRSIEAMPSPEEVAGVLEMLA